MRQQGEEKPTRQQDKGENMSAKDFFKDIRKSSTELKSLEEESERLFTMITSTTIKPKEVDVQTSPTGDKMAEIISKMLELDDKITEQKRVIVEKQLKAEGIITKIDNAKYRAVLRWYYVQNLKWREVSDRMNYDMAYVQRLNGEALAAADKIMKRN